MEADGTWNKPSIEQQQILALVASLTQKYLKTTIDNDTNNESKEDKIPFKHTEWTTTSSAEGELTTKIVNDKKIY